MQRRKSKIPLKKRLKNFDEILKAMDGSSISAVEFEIAGEDTYDPAAVLQTIQNKLTITRVEAMVFCAVCSYQGLTSRTTPVISIGSSGQTVDKVIEFPTREKNAKMGPGELSGKRVARTGALVIHGAEGKLKILEKIIPFYKRLNYSNEDFYLGNEYTVALSDALPYLQAVARSLESAPPSVTDEIASSILRRMIRVINRRLNLKADLAISLNDARQILINTTLRYYESANSKARDTLKKTRKVE